MRRTVVSLLTLAACAALPGAAQAAGTLTVKKNIAKAGIVTAGMNDQIDCGLACVQDAAHFPNDCDDQGICTPPEVAVHSATQTGWSHAFSGCTDGDPEFCSMVMTTSRTVTITYTDIANPTVTIGAPAQDSAVRGTLNLTAQAADNDAVVKVEFLVDDLKIGEDATAPYAISANTAAVSDGPHTFTTKVTDPSGRTSTASRRLVVDNGKPTASITGGTAEGAKVGAPGNVAFTIAGEDATSGVARMECALESGSFAPCDSATQHAIADVAEGDRKFLLRAVDGAGNVSDTVQRSFSVDKTAPTLQIADGPADGALIGRPGRVTYTFEAADARGLAGTQCGFDGAFGECEASYGHGGSPGDGPHTFNVRVTDSHGNATTVARSFVVDTTAPVVTITGGPAQDSTIGPPATAAFTFTSADATSTVDAVECSVDGGAFGACDKSEAHVMRGLGHGRHTLDVRATDAAGNVGTATRAFHVDVTAPETTIDGASTGATAAFTFSASEPGSTFACRLYRAGVMPPAFGACDGASGSHSTSGLAEGEYVFEVIATDAFGNADTSPASRSFTVARQTPPPPPTAERIDSTLTVKWKRAGKRMRVARMNLTGIPAGATVQLSCKGKGCAFKKKSIPFKAASLKLAPLFKKKALVAGAALEVRVVKPGAIGKVETLKIRKKGKPTHRALCLPVGATAPTAC